MVEAGDSKGGWGDGLVEIWGLGFDFGSRWEDRQARK